MNESEEKRNVRRNKSQERLSKIVFDTSLSIGDLLREAARRADEEADLHRTYRDVLKAKGVRK